jgi:hypothetical protein
MTRLSSFERTALGRSAFEQPLRDENGDFIINPHAFDTNAPSYVQQFNESGRPINPESTRDERRLRRAQNEILQVVGVTRSRHAREQQRLRSDKPSEAEIVELLEDENSLGSLLRTVWTIPMDLSVWWLVSHRYRLLVSLLGRL